MERYIETKNVLKLIAKEISAKCASKGQTVSTDCSLRIVSIQYILWEVSYLGTITLNVLQNTK